MSVRKHPLLRWLLVVVLLVNATVTANAWAMNLPVGATVADSGQPGDSHGGHMSAHCADAMADDALAGATVVDESAPSPSDHEHTPTDGCCTPGSCHCASSTLPRNVSLSPESAPLLRVASIAPRDQRAAPAPALTRHFRPPIR